MFICYFMLAVILCKSNIFSPWTFCLVLWLSNKTSFEFYKDILHFLIPDTALKNKINNWTKWQIFTWHPIIYSKGKLSGEICSHYYAMATPSCYSSSVFDCNYILCFFLKVFTYHKHNSVTISRDMGFFVTYIYFDILMKMMKQYLMYHTRAGFHWFHAGPPPPRGSSRSRHQLATNATPRAPRAGRGRARRRRKPPRPPAPRRRRRAPSPPLTLMKGWDCSLFYPPFPLVMPLTPAYSA